MAKVSSLTPTLCPRMRLELTSRLAWLLSGWHNVAESQYGTESWDAHYSKLYTDGHMTWGPDPALTPLGNQQALAVNRAWHDELALDDGPQLPNAVWTSPLRRAAESVHTGVQGEEVQALAFPERDWLTLASYIYFAAASPRFVSSPQDAQPHLL